MATLDLMADQSVLGVTELAERWGRSREGIHQLHRRNEIPPGARLRSGIRKGILVWTLAEIEAYEAEHPDIRKPQA